MVEINYRCLGTAGVYMLYTGYRIYCGKNQFYKSNATNNFSQKQAENSKHAKILFKIKIAILPITGFECHFFSQKRYT